MTKTLFSSKETKSILKISDCELMHLRSDGGIPFTKKGRSFFYLLNDDAIYEQHPLVKKVVNWHKEKHDYLLSNEPANNETKTHILSLVKNILIPLERQFGEITITYGFVSAGLNTYIQKHNPSGTYPPLDQHAGLEVNSKEKRICDRAGVACDFYIDGFEKQMNEVLKFIVNNLEFDKIYYYDKTRPVHISVSDSMQKHLQLMGVSKSGRRIPLKRAYGVDTIKLVEELK